MPEWPNGSAWRADIPERVSGVRILSPPPHFAEATCGFQTVKCVTRSFMRRVTKMYYVYLVKLKNDDIYTGSTPNLKDRLKEHNHGKCKSTKNLKPARLLWFGAFRNKLSARRFEKYLKTGSGQAFRNKRLI